MSVHHCTKMPSLVTQTREQLSKLASPDEFEALATAVLRVPAGVAVLDKLPLGFVTPDFLPVYG